MGMGRVPIIEAIVTVMIRDGVIAQGVQLLAHHQKQVLLNRFLHTVSAICRHQARQIRKFPRDGASAPKRLVILCELNALGGQAVEGGGQLRVDDLGGKRFSCNKN